MSERLEYTREIPIVGEYQVVVCGGGPAGCTAALAARREGLSVLLVESQAQLGGTATSGLVSHWLGGRTEGGEWVVGGLFRSLVEEAASAGVALIPTHQGDRVYQPHGWLPWFIHGIPLDPLGVTRLLDKRMAGVGVTTRLVSQALDVRVEGQWIKEVILAGKSGLSAVRCHAVVDATGDGDIAARSGCDYRIGRQEDGMMTPVTLAFHAEGVDHDELSRVIHRDGTPKFRRKISELRELGHWPFPYDIFISVQLVDPDTALINTSRIVGVDGTSEESLSKGLVQGRRESAQLMEILRCHFPGFASARIKSVASMLGVRESRRIEGVFRLTVQDLSSRASFDDAVGFSIYGWDLPDPQRPSVQPLIDESGGGFKDRVEKGLATPIPYRILLPKPVQNLICVGRCVSVERDVLGPLRVMAPSMAMGEAAGTAAAQTVVGKRPFCDVDTDELRVRLRSHGAIVDEDSLPPIQPRRDP